MRIEDSAKDEGGGCIRRPYWRSVGDPGNAIGTTTLRIGGSALV